MGVDRVGERKDALDIAIVVLEGNADVHAAALVFDNDRFVQRIPPRVKEADEIGQPVRVLEDLFLAIAFVPQRDLQVLVQVGKLAHPPLDDVVLELNLLEYLFVGFEGDLGAGLLGLAGNGQPLLHVAALKLHPVDLAVARHFRHEVLGERVHDRHADAVQAARNRVDLVLELRARMQHRQHDLERRALLGRVVVNRDAAAVIIHRHFVIGDNRDADVVTEPGQGLVDRVVDHLVDEVVHPAHADVADVHRRAVSNGFEAF